MIFSTEILDVTQKNINLQTKKRLEYYGDIIFIYAQLWPKKKKIIWSQYDSGFAVKKI